MLPGALQQSLRATPNPRHYLVLPASGIFPFKWWGSDTWLCCTFSDSNEFKPPLQVITLLPHLLSTASAPRHGAKHFYSYCPSFSQKPEVGTAPTPCGEAEASLPLTTTLPATSPAPRSWCRALTTLQRQADLPFQLHCGRSVGRLFPQPLLNSPGCERGARWGDLPHRWRLAGNLEVKRQHVRPASPSLPSTHLSVLASFHSPDSAVLGSVTRTGAACVGSEG